MKYTKKEEILNILNLVYFALNSFDETEKVQLGTDSLMRLLLSNDFIDGEDDDILKAFGSIQLVSFQRRN
ncbi:hypothetical protein [Vibrio ostreae]|uniref:Uncharacterized protein n=1 Tax=Vibrio ostreae TaxID=2841925 RepID=A0A975UE36_9VIBR|nr:hypothetical protein [Vibrio ostreae]QXO19227.1 hypothetical protein KNV97_13660 [Vibrio ostreae]